MNCKNCGQIVDGDFCSQCGQSSKVDKINLSNFLKEIPSSVFQIDKGLFYTLKELLIRPGYSINDFLNGKRKNHFKPVAYALIFSTIYFLISRLVGESTWMGEFIAGFSSVSSHSGSSTKVPLFFTWLSKNFAYSTLLLLPVFSFASYISFSGLGKNYLEHIVLNSYVTGQQAIFYVIFVLLMPLSDNEFLEIAPIFISIFYAFWVYWQFFTEGNRIINILRSILTYAIYMMFIFGLFFISMAIQKQG